MTQGSTRSIQQFSRPDRSQPLAYVSGIDERDEDFDTAYRTLCLFGNCVRDNFQGLYWLLRNLEFMAEGSACDLRTNAPVICCGSGHTLDANLANIRDVQHGAVIVCAETTAKILLRNGIVPDVVTPTERIMANSDILDDCPSDTWYAGSPFATDRPSLFDRHAMLVGGFLLYRWLEYPWSKVLSYGGSSGTAACAVSRAMGNRVHLCGHSMVEGHCSDHDFNKAQIEHSIKLICNDGAWRPSKTSWVAFNNDTDIILNGAEAISHDLQGAVLNNVPYEPFCVTPVSHKRIWLCDTLDWDVEAAKRTRARVPGIWRDLDRRIMQAETIKDVDIATLAYHPADVFFVQSLLQPLYVRLSLVRKLEGIDRDAMLPWFQEAWSNASRELGEFVGDFV